MGQVVAQEERMYANVVTFQGAIERIEEGIRMFQERVAPVMRGHAGFKGHYLLVDRQRGKTIGISLWETEAHAEANAAALAELRAQATQFTGQPAPAAERFEVVSQP